MSLRHAHFSFADLFAGIGGFRIALERLGGRCLGFSEIDKKAIETYRRNFVGEENELGSVSKLDELPFKPDLITGGVPCQSWSCIGKRLGFNDPRGRLWFDAIRIVSRNQPKAFIFENVKGLYDHRNKDNLDFIVRKLTEAGYSVKYQLMNSFDFGLPQSRERIYLVGIRNDLASVLRGEYEFPRPICRHPPLSEFLDGFPISKNGQVELFGDCELNSENDTLEDFFVLCDTRGGLNAVHSWDLQDVSEEEALICDCLMRNRRRKKYGDKDGNPLSAEILSSLLPNGIVSKERLDNLVGRKILKFVEGIGYEFVNSKISSGIGGVYRIYMPDTKLFPTLTATGMNDYVSTTGIPFSEDSVQRKKEFIEQIYNPGNYRMISPREAARLQGFPECFLLPAKKSVAIHQLGNAVSVPVVFEIANQILKTGCFG